VKVRFFGSLSDRIGREIELTPPAAGCTIAELRRSLAEAYPGAAAELARPTVRACVDDVIVPDTYLVSAQSRVAFFPPLSGG